MKKIKIFILMGLSLLFLSGCSFPGLASNDDEDTIAVTGESPQKCRYLEVSLLEWLNIILTRKRQ